MGIPNLLLLIQNHYSTIKPVRTNKDKPSGLDLCKKPAQNLLRGFWQKENIIAILIDLSGV